MSEDFERIQNELDSLTEISGKINDCQRELQNLEIELKFKHDNDKKSLLDLRLKHGKKIEEANQFYKSISDLDNEKLKLKFLQTQLTENQQNLSNCLSDISPDISDVKSNEIKFIREKINQIKLDIQVSSVNISSKCEVVANMLKKYQRSIDISKNYFHIKETSMANTKHMIELINELRDQMKCYRLKYSTHMTNLEKISTEIHLQRSTQKLVESRLIERIPDGDMSSIGSFNLDDDNVDDRYLFASSDQYDKYSQSASGISQSHNHLDNFSEYPNESNLPSPCRSINLPFNQRSGSVISRASNISWHPLL